MHPMFRNIIAFLAGLIIGGLCNYYSLQIFGSIFGVPEGVDPTDIESIKDNMHLYEFKHFLTPFLAHALGSLIAAFVCTKIAAKYHLGLSLGLGLLYLFGGYAMVMSLPSPTWFNVMDLSLAYFPMVYLGWFLAGRKR